MSMDDLRISSETTIRTLCSGIASGTMAEASVVSSAVATGVGVSLLIMVAKLPATRSGSVDDRSALLASATALRLLQRRLLDAIDEQTVAALLTARRLPQSTERKRAEREAAIQVALRTAADVPLEVMRVAVHSLRQAEIIVARGSRPAVPDTALAVALLREGLIGARTSLEQKVPTLADETYTNAILDEMAHLSEAGLRAAETIAAVLQGWSS